MTGAKGGGGATMGSGAGGVGANLSAKVAKVPAAEKANSTREMLTPGWETTEENVRRERDSVRL